jgi:hypothetical protein
MKMSAVVKDYLTPAPNNDAIRKALLVGRHLIILNNCGSKRFGSVAWLQPRPATEGIDYVSLVR